MSAAAASKGKGKLDAKGADAKGADVKGAAAKGADDIDSLFEDARKRKQNAAAEQRQQRKVETAASKRPRLAVAGGEGDDSSDDDAAGSSSRSGGLPGEYRGTGGKFELSKEPKHKASERERQRESVRETLAPRACLRRVASSERAPLTASLAGASLRRRPARVQIFPHRHASARRRREVLPVRLRLLLLRIALRVPHTTAAATAADPGSRRRRLSSSPPRVPPPPRPPRSARPRRARGRAN